MQVVMLTQALCSCRGIPTLGNDVGGEVGRPLLATQAVRRAASLVNELREHCDDYGRLMQQRGGEALERRQPNTRHLQRMESLPTREVRPRLDRTPNPVAGTSGSTGHVVDRVMDNGGRTVAEPEMGEDSDLSSFMQGRRHGGNALAVTPHPRTVPPGASLHRPERMKAPIRMTPK